MNREVHQYAALLRHYLAPLWPEVLLLSALLFGSIGLQLYTPQVLKGIIDGAMAGAPVDGLIQAALLFLSLVLANGGVSVGATYLSQDLGWRATNQLRTDLTLHALRLDLSYHTSRTPGEMIERIDGDVTLLANLFSQFVVLIVANGLLLVGVLLVLYRVDWRAGLVLTGFAALNLVVLLKSRGPAMAGWQAARQASAEYVGFLGERLTATEEIRANGAEGHVLRQFIQQMRSRLAAELKAGRGMAIMLILSFGLLALGTTTAFGVSAYLVTTGAISLGSAYMIFYYTEQLRRPLEQIAGQVQELARAGAAVGRVSQLRNLRSRVMEGATALPDGALGVAFEAVTFGYEPKQPVLKELSFRVEPGRVLALLGRTGSGKSTVMRLLARLHAVDQGSITLAGHDLREVSPASLRQRVGVVTQEVQLFAGSLRENLTLFDGSIPDRRIWTALDEVGLRSWAEALPRKLDTELTAGGGLSAGESQLLAFARLLLKEPGLVILDEPSSRLDPATERRLEQALGRLLAGRTAILIAHRLSTLERADQVVILADGRIAEQGDRSALAAEPSSRFHQLLRAGLAEEVVA